MKAICRITLEVFQRFPGDFRFHCSNSWVSQYG
jgi:hypothetical protein